MPGGSYTLLPGGKGANQALAAHRAGAAVMLAGAVGRDGFAAVALSSLRSEGVDRRLVRDLDLPTGCAVSMVLAAAENTIAVAPGAKMGVQCDRVPDELLDANTISSPNSRCHPPKPPRPSAWWQANWIGRRDATARRW